MRRVTLAEFILEIAEAFSGNLPKGNVCPCHEDCLKPGNPRRANCTGEDPSGCRNCRCFGLCSVDDWEKLSKERGIRSPIKARRPKREDANA